jgi:hypothetical protein
VAFAAACAFLFWRTFVFDDNHKDQMRKVEELVPVSVTEQKKKERKEEKE